MHQFFQFYGKILKILEYIYQLLGNLLLSVIVGSIFVQVFSRYLLNRPHIWVEELATYCFIWLVFVGAAYAHIKKRHIIVTTLVDCFYKPLKRALLVLSNIFILTFLTFGLIYGLRHFKIEAPQFTIALPIKLPRRIFYSTPFLFGIISMMIITVYDLFRSIKEFLTPPPDPECEEVEK